jgi:excisionase family DNA binding protein
MRLLTVEEASARLKLGRATTYRLIARGVLPTVRIGRARRIVEEDLNRFIEELRSGASCAVEGGGKPDA